MEILEERLTPATLTVNSVADNTLADAFLTLREAMLLVDNGGDANAALGRNLTSGEAAQISGTFGNNDSIQFDPALNGQTITLGSALPQITANLSLIGPGASQLAVSGNGAVQVFGIASGVSAQLSGLTIENGQAAYGGGISNFGMLTLTGSTVSGNSAGGAAGASNFGTMSLTDSTVSGNSATYEGGGIDNFGTLTLTNSTVSGNQAQSNGGGGIYNFGTVTLANSTVSGNVAGFGGGGIANYASYNFGTVTLTDSRVSGNYAKFGGGIAVGVYATLTLTGSTVSGNHAHYDGGGIRNLGHAVTLTDSRVSGNHANTGAGITNGNYSTLTLTNCSLLNNVTAQPYGYGGGIDNGGTLTVTASTLVANSATNGGGIFNVGTLTLTNSTLSYNHAHFGGGISNYNFGLRTATLTVTNSTVAHNQASFGGGIYESGTLTKSIGTLRNSIVADNLAPSGADILGTVLANSSLIQSLDQTTFAGGSGNNITGQDPLLGPLQDNGGPTLTMALLPGSPAIDAGDNSLALDANGNPLTTDQRGQPYVRIYGAHVDMGAFEDQPVPVIVAVRPSALFSDFGQSLTFTATVSGLAPAFGTPSGSVDFFDTTTATDLGSVPLVGGTASLATTSLPLGAHTITVSYSGDATFLAGSTSLPMTILPSIYVLDPSASPALRLSGNTGIDIPGLVQVDSSSTSALTAGGNARLRAGSIQVVGGFVIQDNASISPVPTTGVAPVPDPLAALPAPSGGIRQGSVNLTQGSQTIDPGIYDQIQVSGTGSLTLNPGIYVIAGGGLAVTDQGSMAGSGVLLYNAGSNYVGGGSSFGGINLSGLGTINLTPASTGPYAGILIFQSRDNVSTISLNGKAAQEIPNSILYAPAATLSLSDKALLPDTIVVNQLQLGISGDSGLPLNEQMSAIPEFSQFLGVDQPADPRTLTSTVLASKMAQPGQGLNLADSAAIPGGGLFEPAALSATQPALLVTASAAFGLPRAASFGELSTQQNRRDGRVVNSFTVVQATGARLSKDWARLLSLSAKMLRHNYVVDELFAQLGQVGPSSLSEE